MGYCLHVQTDGHVCSEIRVADFTGRKICIDTNGGLSAHRDGQVY